MSSIWTKSTQDQMTNRLWTAPVYKRIYPRGQALNFHPSVVQLDEWKSAL
ncbi:MAG: hypothetical protein AAF702_21725 [Chloroflexota bacterium]